MAVIRHTPIEFTCYADVAEDPNYPATNLTTPGVRRRFRSASGGDEIIGIILPIGVTDGCVCVQDISPGVTINSIYVYGAGYAVTPPVFTLPDGAGRYKLSFVVEGATVVEINFGSPPGGEVSIGSIFFMTGTENIPDALLSPEASAQWPQNRIDLPNGTTIPVDRGPAHSRLNLRYREPRGGDIERIARLARDGICWIDMQLPDDPAQQYPVRCVSDSVTRTMRATQDEVAIELIEVA